MLPPNAESDPAGPWRRRRDARRGGCLGSLLKLGAFLVVAGVAFLGFLALVEPWAFYLGGAVHLIPYWQGWGRVRSRAGGEYLVYVGLEPDGRTRLGSAYLNGVAFICTPKHERMRLRMNATMRKGIGRNTEGEAIHFHMYAKTAIGPATRPRIELVGRWRGNRIVGTDIGSIAQAFLPDGSVNRGSLPAARDTVPVTITGGPRGDFDAACRASGRGPT